MWIMLNDSFLSIVCDRNDHTRLHIRARLSGDIERVFPGAAILATPDADYAFRASLSRADVVCEISARLLSTDYPDFKQSVAEDDRHDAYLEVWSVLRQLQRQRSAAARNGTAAPKPNRYS